MYIYIHKSYILYIVLSLNSQIMQLTHLFLLEYPLFNQTQKPEEEYQLSAFV